MTLPNNQDKLERFIHECFHEIARDEEMKDVWRDMVSIIISKWEDFKENNFETDNNLCQCGHERKYHAKIQSHNYTDGKCSKCKCQYFLIKKD